MANTINCDSCGEDITKTGAMPDYRLRLSTESLPSDSCVKYSIMVYPPIDNDKHFCGVSCLSDWVTDKERQ